MLLRLLPISIGLRKHGLSLRCHMHYIIIRYHFSSRNSGPFHKTSEPALTGLSDVRHQLAREKQNGP